MNVSTLGETGLPYCTSDVHGGAIPQQVWVYEVHIRQMGGPSLPLGVGVGTGTQKYLYAQSSNHFKFPKNAFGTLQAYEIKNNSASIVLFGGL